MSGGWSFTCVNSTATGARARPSEQRRRLTSPSSALSSLQALATVTGTMSGACTYDSSHSQNGSHVSKLGSCRCICWDLLRQERHSPFLWTGWVRVGGVCGLQSLFPSNLPPSKAEEERTRGNAGPFSPPLSLFTARPCGISGAGPADLPALASGPGGCVSVESELLCVLCYL